MAKAQEPAYQEVLETIVRAIVNNPDDVKVERRVDEMGVLLSLHVNPQDMGLVVGRGGAMARSIRSIMRVVGLKNHARINLKIEEPEGARRAPGREERPERGRPAKRGEADDLVGDLKL